MTEDKSLTCSEITQIKLADALKSLMELKSFEKISVSDITNYCSVHRQTFYYHFADKYELLNWICRREIIEPLTEDFSLDNMYDKLSSMFTDMRAQKSFYQSALKINVEVLFNYISNLVVDRLEQTFDDIERENGLQPKDTKENKLLAEFFGYGISGIVLKWASSGMKETPKELTMHIKSIVDSCKKLAIMRSKL